MKLILENWRKFLKEALEYDSQKAGGLSSLFHVPEKIKQLIDEVETLNKQSTEAYESGDLEKAEELDAQFADKQEELESAMDEMGYEGESKTGMEKYSEANPLDQLSEEFAIIYWSYVNERLYNGFILTKEELLERLRVVAKDYGWEFGGFKEETTDEQLLDAAKDSHDRKAVFLKRYKLATADKSREKQT